MNINLIGAFRYPCSIEKYYARALHDLGHNLIVTYPGARLPPEEPDLTIVVKYCPNPQLLPHPRILIFTDLTSRFQQYYDTIQSYFDYIFLVHNEHIVDNKRVFFVPVGYDPMEHRYIESPKDIDCLFIGTMHPSREFMKDIPSITRFGNEWGDTHDVYGQEYRELCSRAKIIINHHYPGDTFNMRDFEAPAFHALILTDKTPFKDLEDVVLYFDKEDLKEKIDWFLETENEENRRSIAEHGYETVTTGKYTYKDRVEKILKIISGK